MWVLSALIAKLYSQYLDAGLRQHDGEKFM